MALTMVLSAAVLCTAALVVAANQTHRHAARSGPRTLMPILDPRAERELRSRYLTGQISIDVYLDGKFGTTYSSAGNHERAG